MEAVPVGGTPGRRTGPQIMAKYVFYASLGEVGGGVEVGPVLEATGS